jgi:SNF2 family DNA or RNA helicase
LVEIVDTQIKHDILNEYDFPVFDKEKPAFHVQKITCSMLANNKRAYVLNDLGTGKTRCVLWTFDFLKRNGQQPKLLILCPISTMVRVWGRELMKEFPWLKYVVLYGSKSKRVVGLAKPDVDVFILNHDGLEVIFDELMARPDISMVCADELSVAYRNGGSDRTKLFKQFVHNKDYVWGMTGSPIPRAVTDVWGPCSAITPHTVPRYFNTFKAQLMIKKPNGKLWGWDPKPRAEERAVSCMQPSVRFTLDDVTELPPRVTAYYEAELTPKQKSVYDGMRRSAVALIGSQKIDALNAGAVLSKLLQIALGYVYTREGTTIGLDNTPRLQLIIDLIDSASRKVILFAPFKSAIKALSALLTKNDIDHGIITGDTPVGKRNHIFGQFQDTKFLKVLLAHPVCMSHGLTLTAANTVIWAGPPLSLETFIQANARPYRVGQEHKTLIAMIGGTPVEKKIYKMLGNNEKLQDRFLELVADITEEQYS